MKPRYPVYVPSKGRYDSGLTMKLLLKDECPFYLVVEPQETDEYGKRYGYERLLILPWSGNDEVRQAFTAERGIENGGLIAVRNWIKEHSITAGHQRHWQLDDNIQYIKRRYKGKRIPCDSGMGLAVVEDFVDRYENIAIAGMNYEMFLPNGQKIPPFYLNVHVYSCSLILNSIPHRWRQAFNDDTDICLQVLASGWCTVLINAFLVWKMWTMHTPGGNTTDLYQGDGRLKMARSLERMWPGVVTTGRRFQRPQHIVKDAWRRFDTPLKLKPGINLDELPKVDEYGMKLMQVKEIKSEDLRRLVQDRLE
jgi:hypothetical protein